MILSAVQRGSQVGQLAIDGRVRDFAGRLAFLAICAGMRRFELRSLNSAKERSNIRFDARSQ